MSMKTSMLNPKKQRGMTLMMTLIILAIMTIIITVSSKLSVFDTLLARNNKVKILAYQATANDLRQLAKIENLHDPMTNKKFGETTGIYNLPTDTSNKAIKEVITDLGIEDDELYDCEGFSGRARSLGSSARKCDLFDFQVTRQEKGLNGAKENHHVGMGKEVPSSSKYSNL